MRVGPTAFMPQGGKLLFSIYAETCETAIAVFDEDTGEPLTTATVCLPRGSPRAGPDEVWVKDWSENTGVFAALVLAGVITDVGTFAPCGHTVARLGQLMPDAIRVRNAAFEASPGLLVLRDQVYPREVSRAD